MSFKTMLVAVDGSELALKAVDVETDLACAASA